MTIPIDYAGCEPQHGRLRRHRFAKWTGACLCITILIGWCVSLWRVTWTHMPLNLFLQMDSGRLTLGSGNGVYVFVPARSIQPHGLRDLGLDWPWIFSQSHPPYREIVVPFWLLFVVVAVPTTLLFYRGRKATYRRKHPGI